MYSYLELYLFRLEYIFLLIFLETDLDPSTKEMEIDLDRSTKIKGERKKESKRHLGEKRKQTGDSDPRSRFGRRKSWE